MKKVLLGLIITFSVALAGSAQTSLGLRFGGDAGVTLKHMLNETNAVEAIANTYGGYNFGGLVVTGLYTWNKPLPNAENFNYFYGLGATIGFYDSGNGAGVLPAVSGQLGVQYNFANAPFNISLDWIPQFYLTNSAGFYARGFGLSGRYVF